jgi:cystathionine beta-lyase/cystathionine gamma-synthase
VSSKRSESYDSLETKVVHAGEPVPRIEGSVSMPVFQSSTYVSGAEEDYHDIRYVRLNNSPNHDALHAKLAALENGEAALVAASGMAVISTALLSVLASDDHVMALDCLYGGTHSLLTRDLAGYRVSYSFIDGHDRSTWEKALQPNTKAVYVETLTNPLIQLPDLRGIAEFARQHGLVSIVDNTFASPVNFRPPEIGFDLSLHSATKYLNGHTDLAAGAVIGRADLIDTMKRRLDHLGGVLDPHTCFLLHRGIKTLPVRVHYQNRSAGEIAAYLDSHPLVTGVNYPGLAGHPQHELATELLDGYGGMLSFELSGGQEAAQRLIDRLRIPIHAPSLGGVETLITRPAASAHAGLSPEERAASGISDGLIRMSIGLEGTEELIRDLGQALDG